MTKKLFFKLLIPHYCVFPCIILVCCMEEVNIDEMQLIIKRLVNRDFADVLMKLQRRLKDMLLLVECSVMFTLFTYPVCIMKGCEITERD